MADLTESPMSGMDPEYQAQLQKLLRQRQLAEFFQKQAFQERPTEVVSGHAVKRSGLENIARALAGGLSSYKVSQADTGISNVQQQAAKAQSGKVQALMGLPTQQRIASALASTDPRIQALGMSWAKQAQEAAVAGGKILGDAGDTGAGIEALRTGMLPGGYVPPNVPEPAFGTTEKGDTYVTTANRKGEKEVKFAPKGVNVTNQLAGKENEMALDTLKADLKERQTRALAARDVLDANQSAKQALVEGARLGGGEGYKQAVRKAAQSFGLEVDTTAPTEQLNMALGSAVLAKARALAPVTKEDVDRLKELLGSVNTDPQALGKMLSIYDAAAHRELQDFNRWLGAQESAISSPAAKSLLAGAGIGFEQRNPSGPVNAQMRTMQELSQRGGDVSQFGISGKPFEEGAQFDIRNPLAAPNKPVPPQESNGLTPDELKRYNELRKRLGLQ